MVRQTRTQRNVELKRMSSLYRAIPRTDNDIKKCGIEKDVIVVQSCMERQTRTQRSVELKRMSLLYRAVWRDRLGHKEVWN